MFKYLIAFSVFVLLTQQICRSQTEEYSASELVRRAEENWRSIESIDVTFTLEEKPIAANEAWLDKEGVCVQLDGDLGRAGGIAKQENPLRFCSVNSVSTST